MLSLFSGQGCAFGTFWKTLGVQMKMHKVSWLSAGFCVMACGLMTPRDVAAAAIQYTYDQAGRLTSVDYGGGARIAYAYDANGNLLLRQATSANGLVNVTGFTATPGNGQVTLGWVNPEDENFAGVKILRKTGGYPSSPSDGAVVYNGTGTGATDIGLVNGTPCYYTAFSYDAAPNYSSGVTATATPVAPPDTTPPANVTGFTATPGNAQVELAWSLPADADFAGVKILRRTGSYPASPSDGTAVYNGAGTGTTDTGLVNGTEYFYKAFSYDGVPNYASGATASAVPAAPTPAWDAGYQDLGGGWRRLGWFGDYALMGGDGWIWHNKHGFFYIPANALPEDVWLYAQDMGWLWTGNAVYPFFFRSTDGVWLWYNGATNPRWFVNMATGTWEAWP
jgi:YD repeat-containing protein